jgi:hypothetical protein
MVPKLKKKEKVTQRALLIKLLRLIQRETRVLSGLRKKLVQWIQKVQKNQVQPKERAQI